MATTERATLYFYRRLDLNYSLARVVDKAHQLKQRIETRQYCREGDHGTMDRLRTILRLHDDLKALNQHPTEANLKAFLELWNLNE